MHEPTLPSRQESRGATDVSRGWSASQAAPQHVAKGKGVDVYARGPGRQVDKIWLPEMSVSSRLSRLCRADYRQVGNRDLVFVRALSGAALPVPSRTAPLRVTVAAPQDGRGAT